MKNLILLVLLVMSFGCVNAQAKSEIVDSKKLIGTWTLQKDHRSQAVFTQSEELDYYAKHLMSRFTWTIKKDTLISIDQKNSEVYSYLITLLTEKNLTLKIIRTGTTLEYKKE